jgi:hypothetical protein
MEGGGDICEVCQENIRAEAVGRHKKIAREVPQKAAQVRIRERKGVKKDTTSPPPPHSEEEEKKPRDFKSMAEYLDYLKKKQ